jgi:hypothetical protein
MFGLTWIEMQLWRLTAICSVCVCVCEDSARRHLTNSRCHVTSLFHGLFLWSRRNIRMYVLEQCIRVVREQMISFVVVGFDLFSVISDWRCWIKGWRNRMTWGSVILLLNSVLVCRYKEHGGVILRRIMSELFVFKIQVIFTLLASCVSCQEVLSNWDIILEFTWRDWGKLPETSVNSRCPYRYSNGACREYKSTAVTLHQLLWWNLLWRLIAETSYIFYWQRATFKENSCSVAWSSIRISHSWPLPSCHLRPHNHSTLYNFSSWY